MRASAISQKIGGSGLVPGEHEWLHDCAPYFIPRDIAELDEEFRQLVPYVLITHQGSGLVYRRAPKSGESRLHDKISIGFGGHVELTDIVLRERTHAKDPVLLDVPLTLSHAAIREVTEELKFAPVQYRKHVGLIVSDDEPVSRVHVAVVAQWELTNCRASIRECDALIECRFVPFAELRALAPQMEGWARLCAEWLVENGETE